MIANTAAASAAAPGAEGAHHFALRVYYEDTDAAGIVYYANYLKFAERARTELLRSLGFEQEALRRTSGLAFVVRRCVIEYRAPARLDDMLDLATRLVRLGGASFDLVQSVRRGEMELARLELRIAVLDGNGRAARLPGGIVRAFTSFSRQLSLQEYLG